LGKELGWGTSLRLGGVVALVGCVAGFVMMRWPVS
jgi:hypothetical protein